MFDVIVKFKNKILTNIVVTTGTAAAFGIVGSYLLNAVSEVRLNSLITSFALLALSWPCIFLFRSLALPKSITFLNERMVVENLILGKSEFAFDEIVAVSSKALSNNEEKYVFKMRNGKRFQLALETYDVRKLRTVLNENGIPR